MAAGFGLLHLTPQAFWAMTPMELAAALGPLLGNQTAVTAPTRGDLLGLMQRFPDIESSTHERDD